MKNQSKEVIKIFITSAVYTLESFYWIIKKFWFNIPSLAKGQFVLGQYKGDSNHGMGISYPAMVTKSSEYYLFFQAGLLFSSKLAIPSRVSSVFINVLRK